MRRRDSACMKIAICTDAWLPQVNGVVTTLSRTRDELETFGHEVQVFSPASGFRTFPLPTYPEIRLAWWPGPRLARLLEEFTPDRVHIATEGPIGLAARAWCLRHGWRFTTSYHTRFPELVQARLPVPVGPVYRLLRWFHGHADATLVATPQMRAHLQAQGFANVVLWGRGVDTALFAPTRRLPLDLPRPVWVYAGRLAVEKNLEAFLALPLPGSKLVIGDGPDRARLAARFPTVHFAGYRFGAELAGWIAAGDVFVFPSRSETFGLVMLEAMACGLPVAAYPVTGPIDVVQDGVTGVLRDDLHTACLAALALDRAAVRAAALRCSWERAAREFESHLVPLRPALLPAPA